MFRKTILAIAATAALGAAALAPTAASAGGYHNHGHHGSYGHHNHYKSYGYRSHYAPAYASYNSACVWKKRWVESDYGTVVKWVKVCY